MTTSPLSENDGLTVRQAVRADLLSVYRIEKQSFPNPWPFSAFERFLDEPGFLVAIDDDLIVGYVVADVIPNHGRPVGHIKDLAVRPNHREQGVGATLMARALMVLAQSNVSSVKLEVRRDNEAARALYREFGFEPVHVVSDYYENGEDAVVLVCELRP